MTLMEPWGRDGEDLYMSCTMPSIEVHFIVLYSVRDIFTCPVLSLAALNVKVMVILYLYRIPVLRGSVLDPE